MSFDTVDLLTGKVFQVTWDLGRRCNYDCSYCPVTRHNNFSPHASLDSLKKNAEFMFEYISAYMEYRTFKVAAITFTGGEPTVNPHFMEFVKWLKKEYQERYKHKWSARFSVTSNGAMSEKNASAIADNMNHITVSYHTEADDKLKSQAKKRIVQFNEEAKARSEFNLSINVMFHAERFDECKDLCTWLDEKGIFYVPRVIGEEADSPASFAHKYNQEQIDYMKNFWNKKNANLNKDVEEANQLSAVGKKTSEKKKLGMSIGRPCCGSREMCLSKGNESRKSTFVDFREFKGWHCSVNWFFLHIEQETDKVFHHQTCQAKFGGERGYIGRMGRGGAEIMLKKLREQLTTGTMPTIICPKHTCGCGLCAPKSKYKDKYFSTIDSHIDKRVFANTGDADAL